MDRLFSFLQIKMAAGPMKKERAAFYFDLATMLEDKVTLLTALRKYEQRARERKQLKAKVYEHMVRNLRTGSLALALGPISTPTERLLIEAIQRGGDLVLAQGLRFLSETVEKADEMGEAIRNAVIYPIIMLTVFSVLLSGFAVFVTPVLADILPPEEWPQIGRVLYTVSQVVQNYGLYIALGIAAFLATFFFSLPRWTGASRKFLDKRLPYSIYRDFNGSMLVVSLASMMQSGISLRSAIEKMMHQATPWMRWHLRQMLYVLSQSDSAIFGRAFRSGVLSTTLEDRVQDASERRNPVEAFVKIGVTSMDRMKTDIEKSSKKMNTAMLLFCGVILMTMMGGFFATAFELQKGITQHSQNTSIR